MDSAVLRLLGVLALVSVSATAGAVDKFQIGNETFADMQAAKDHVVSECNSAYNSGSCDSARYVDPGTSSNNETCSRNSDEVGCIFADGKSGSGISKIDVTYNANLWARACDGDTYQIELAGSVLDPDSDCQQEDCQEVADGDNDYWGGGIDKEFTEIGARCDPETNCTVTPKRFHELVDGTVTTEWTHTGAECGDGTEDIGKGEANTDGCVGSGAAEFCYEDSGNLDETGNCGTFNGERVCFDAVPEDGTCTGADGPGSSYTCATQGDYSVIPELPDGQTADEEAAVTMANATAEATVTVSGGSVVEGDEPLDETTPPTEGEEGAGDHDGTGDGEGEEDGLCDKAPHLCEEGEADVENKEVPEDSEDIGNLVGGGDYPGILSGGAGCPEPQSIALPDSLGGGTLDIPFTAFCDMAEILRPLVLGLAYLTAFYAAVRILA